MVKIRGTIKLRLCPTCVTDGKATKLHNGACSLHGTPYVENKMAKKTTTTRKSTNKPTLIVVGESMVDPNDVSAIKKIRSKTDLYIIILKSQPNMEFPFWANAAEVATLLEHFRLVE